MNLSLKVIIISFVTVSWGRAEANEQETLLPVDATPVSRMESKTKDKSRSPGLFGEYWWANRFLERHKLVESLRGKSVDLVMVGDSITHYWEWKHPESWAAFTSGRTVLNLGYGGDRTDTVIWRLLHGEVDGYQAKTIVLEVGTNNNSSKISNPTNVATGIRTIISILREKQPSARIILHPIFPCGDSPNSAHHAEARYRNEQTNCLLKDYADMDPHVKWVDFNACFLDENGWVPRRLMSDGIHPTDQGYEIWSKVLHAELLSGDVDSGEGQKME